MEKTGKNHEMQQWWNREREFRFRGFPFWFLRMKMAMELDVVAQLVGLESPGRYKLIEQGIQLPTNHELDVISNFYKVGVEELIAENQITK